VAVRGSKNHFLVVGGVKKRPKKKCGAENRKTQTLLQATVCNMSSYFDTIKPYSQQADSQDQDSQYTIAREPVQSDRALISTLLTGGN
jgi:hypothetical protein